MSKSTKQKDPVVTFLKAWPDKSNPSVTLVWPAGWSGPVPQHVADAAVAALIADLVSGDVNEPAPALEIHDDGETHA